MLSTCANVAAAEQPDTVTKSPLDDVEISLLTCSPHDNVYSLYGHTAIRVTDKTSGQDIAINWGVFDFTSDYFVMRFVFGLTDYMMGVCTFPAFLREYSYYGSAVWQQRINMTADEKKRFMQLFYENSRPENVVYRYNYFYNNCTTRARDIILQSISGEVKLSPTPPAPQARTFRQLIHSKNEDHLWARFGNDILLGVGCDSDITRQEREFLPENLMNDFADAVVLTPDGRRKPLVDSMFCVLPAGTPYSPSEGFAMPLSPMQCALLFLCLVAVIVLLARRKGIDVSASWISFLLALPCSIVGIVLVAMIFSKHPTVNLNLQLLICNPVLLYLAFPKTRFKYRWHCVLVLCALFAAGNLLQTYAEGMNLMAGALAIIAAAAIKAQSANRGKLKV